MANREQKPIQWPLALGLSLTGLIMGLLTSLVGLPQFVELGTWVGWYVVWGVVILRMDAPPLSTPLIASPLSGVFTGTTQFLLRDHYVANNPWYADQLAESGFTAGGVIGFGVVMGVIWGLLVGGVLFAVARVRARAS